MMRSERDIVTAKVVQIANEIESDGSHRVIVDVEGKPIEVIVPLGAMNDLMRALQVWVIERSAETSAGGSYPELNLTSVGLAHRPTGAELLVATLQTGYVALLATDEKLRHFRNEIDRVLTFRSGSTTRQ